jgi:hypothetical protein
MIREQLSFASHSKTKFVYLSNLSRGLLPRRSELLTYHGICKTILSTVVYKLRQSWRMLENDSSEIRALSELMK